MSGEILQSPRLKCVVWFLVGVITGMLGAYVGLIAAFLKLGWS